MKIDQMEIASMSIGPQVKIGQLETDYQSKMTDNQVKIRHLEIDLHRMKRIGLTQIDQVKIQHQK